MRRHPWRTAAIVAGSVLTIALAALFNPSLQQRVLLPKLLPLAREAGVETLEVEHLRLTPWSLELRGLHLDYRGLELRLGEAELVFNPFGLLTDTIVVHELRVPDLAVDLTRFRSGPPSTTPFAGVISMLDQGYGLALYDVDVAADVTLDAARRLQASLRGDGVRPHVPGALELGLHYDDGVQQLDADGRLKLDQLSQGRFRELALDAQATLAAPALPAPERLSLTLAVMPAPGTGHLRALIRERRLRGETLSPAPESLQLALQPLDAAGAPRARFEFDGLYRGDQGSLRGRYTLTAGNALVASYLGAQPLPTFALEAEGELGVQTMSGAIDLTLAATTRLTELAKVLGDNPALPPALVLHSGTTLALHGERLALTRFDHALMDESRATPVLALALQPPLVVDLAAPAALLDTPRALGTLALSAVPVPWANGLLQGQTLTGGELSAAFELAVGEERQLQLLPLQALTLGEVAVEAGEDVLVPALRVSLLPTLTKSDARLRLRLDELAIADGARRLAGGRITLTQPLIVPAKDEEAAPEVAAQIADDDTDAPSSTPAAPPPAPALPPLRIAYVLDADLDAVRALPPLAARRDEVPLPDGLRFDAKGAVELQGTQATVATLDAGLAQPTRPNLVELVARQPFALPSADAPFENPRGELASLSLRGIDLAWITAFVPDVVLSGTLAAADLLLSAPAAGRYALRATAPLRVQGVDARLGEAAQVEDLDLVVTPAVDYAPEGLRFDLRQLNLASRGHVLARGDLAGSLPLGEKSKTPLAGEGRLELDLTGLVAQPALRRALAREPPDLALDGRVDFAAAMHGDAIRVGRLAVDLKAGPQASFRLVADEGLEVRPKIARDERLARHVIGEVSLAIRDLSSSVVERFVALDGLAFADFDAELRLSSVGSVLRADSAAPLRVEDVRLSADEQPLLQAFTLGTRAAVKVEGRQLEFDLADFALNFAGNATPALSGRVAATIEPDRAVALSTLDAELAAQLPQWLSQPAVMPGHKLTAGAVNTRIAVTPDGAIAARLALDGLAASAPLAIAHIELPVGGSMAADGRGFSFTAPFSANGKSGTSTAAIAATYAPEPGEQGLLRLRLDSELFYLNDLLATLAAVSPQVAAALPPPPDAKDSAPVAIDLTRDAKAAWDILPYGTALEYRIAKLFYTDYLAFDEVSGKLSVRKKKLAATDVAARFHASQMKLDGTLDYRGDAAEPYRLDVNGTVKDFDLNQFFKELVPGEKPRIKGLFSVKLAANGEMPNLGQLRNETLFDIRMRSNKGVFRPLPPSSTLLVGTSDMLGLVGEGLSYMPTGGFGAGTIARLVNYIARIDYDVVDIRVRRAESRDIVIERFLVRSPTISMTAAGGITREAGRDVVDSPLDLRANLDMSGRGAAILYSMGLLKSEKNDAGYWRGPEFRIWGTPSASESNFADIIRQASDGTVKGGITRPLAGLIGNLKYRWFGDAPDPLPPELAAEVEALEEEMKAEPSPAR
ncbi:MAG: hypothetical protein AB7I32_01240 [Gammaproteobacteria bacterium]